MSTTGSTLDEYELEERLRNTLAAVMPLLDAPSDGATSPRMVGGAVSPSWLVDTAPSVQGRPRRAAVVGAAAAFLLLVGGLVTRLASDAQSPSADAPSATDTITSAFVDAGGTAEQGTAAQEMLAQILDAMPRGTWIAAAVQPGAENAALRLSVFDDTGLTLSFSPLPAGESIGAAQPTLAPEPVGSSGRIAYPYTDGRLLLVDPDGAGVYVSCWTWDTRCPSSLVPAADLAVAADGVFDLVTGDLSSFAVNDGEFIDQDVALRLATDAVGDGIGQLLLDVGVFAQTGDGTYVSNSDGEIVVTQVRRGGLLVRWQLTAPTATSGLTDAKITEALDAALTQAAGAPAPSTTLIDTTTAPTDAPLQLLPTDMPEGFPDDATSYRTSDLEGGQPVSTVTRLYVGTGDTPPVVMVITDPAGSDSTDGLQDFTTDGAWPSYRIDVTRPDGRHDFIATGGLTADQARAVADALGLIDFTESPPVNLPVELTEVPFEHQPESAYAVDWASGSGATITMLVESDHGVHALANGITWPINAVTTPTGTVYVSRDASDPQFVQAGIVIDGHAVNFEAHNVDTDQLARMVASVTQASDQDWIRRTE